MAQHFKQVCSCGATIAQCRCPDPAKSVQVIRNGCHKCQLKALQQAVPVTVEEIEQYPGVKYPRSDFE